MAEKARLMEAEKAAEVLERALKGHRGDLTIADAAARSGLALRDAELGLHHLSARYKGSLSATENGDLLFRFPRGFTLPFVERTGLGKLWDRTARFLKGAAKFVLRAWISIVLVGYVAVFLAIAIALTFAGNSDRRDGPGLNLAGALLRVVAEALYWTFHPFSPFAVNNIYDGGPRSMRRRREREDKVPFYERVNRFVFGPEPPPKDPLETERKLLAQIRTHRGRIGIGDVLRVTGLPRGEADALMAKLMLDYEGEVNVSDDGGITYSFPAMRKTAETAQLTPPPPVWKTEVKAPPVTGNPAGSNLLIAALNGFNLFASFIAIGVGLTVDQLVWLFEQSRTRIPLEPPPPGVPLVLGWIPFVMSLAIFAAPLVRALTQRWREKAAREENGRRAILRTVLDETQQKNAVHEEKLQYAWKAATGTELSDKRLAEEVAKLGGDVDLSAAEKGSERAQYRFRDLEAEVKALEEERDKASEAEREVGAVVFRA